MTTVITFIETHAAVLGVLLAGIPLLVGALGLFLSRIDAELLADKPSWPELIEEFRTTGAATYFKAIQATLKFTARFWGERSISFQAYGRCVQLALGYPAIAVLLGWLLFNTTEISGLPLFDSLDNFWGRLWHTLVLVGAASASGLFFANAPDMAEKLSARVTTKLDAKNQRAGLLVQAARWLIELVAAAFAITIALAGAGAGAVAVAGAVDIDFAIAVGFAFFFALAFAGAGSFAFAFLVAIAFAFANAFTVPGRATILILFFSLLPLLNAAADMASLAITRGFLSRIVERRPALWTIVGQLVFDLILAALCLAALLCAILAALEVSAWLAPAYLIFSWRDYWSGIQADPTTGTALYIMAATTLIPTAVHVIVGLGAVLTQKSRMLARAALTIEGWQTDSADPSLNQRRKLANQIRLAKSVGLFIATALISAVAIAVWALSAWLLG